MISFEINQRVATLVLNHGPANAISLQWVKQFDAILDQLESRNDWNVLRISSALKIFSAGADIKQMQEAFEANSSEKIAGLISAVRDYQRLFERIESLPGVTLAEIGGAALGGGFELALSCDLRIMANEARVGLPEVRIGLLPGAGGTQRLTRLCGRSTAIRIINGAEMVDGPTAVQLGMVHWCVPASELSAAAQKLARQYADQDTQASRLAKACINQAIDPLTHSGFDLEFTGSETLLSSASSQALIKDFFDRKKK